MASTKRAAAPKRPQRLHHVAAIKGSAAWGEWLDGLAQANRASVSATIDMALVRLAQALGQPGPPPRVGAGEKFPGRG